MPSEYLEKLKLSVRAAVVSGGWRVAGEDV